MTMRYQTSPDGGTFSDPENPQSREEAPAKTEAQVRTGNERVRVQADAEGNTTVSDPSKPSGSKSSEPYGPTSGLNQAKDPTPMHLLGPEDSVVDRELGRMQCKVLARMGVLRPVAGGGYEFVRQSDFSTPAPSGAEKATGEEGGATESNPSHVAEDSLLPEDAPVSFSRGLEGLITQTMQRAGEPAVTALATALATGNEKAIENLTTEYGTASGMEAGEARETVAAIVSEAKDIARGLAVKAGLEPHEFEAAEAWLWQHRQKEAMEANRIMFETGDSRPAQKLLAEFAANDAARYSEADIESATFGHGIRVYRDDAGRLMVETPTDRMPWAVAVKQGHVKVSGKLVKK